MQTRCTLCLFIFVPLISGCSNGPIAQTPPPSVEATDTSWITLPGPSDRTDRPARPEGQINFAWGYDLSNAIGFYAMEGNDAIIVVRARINAFAPNSFDSAVVRVHIDAANGNITALNGFAFSTGYYESLIITGYQIPDDDSLQVDFVGAMKTDAFSVQRSSTGSNYIMLRYDGPTTPAYSDSKVMQFIVSARQDQDETRRATNQLIKALMTDAKTKAIGESLKKWNAR